MSLTFLAALSELATAGPPYVSDDPQPTEYQHYEIYLFGNGARARDASTGIGVGLRYDISNNYHLLAYAGPGLQNTTETARYSWYASVLLTF